jgi:hypothetical protein
MTNATQSVLGRTKQIWFGKEFLVRRSLVPGQVLSKQYKRFSLNCHRRTDAPNVFFS